MLIQAHGVFFKMGRGEVDWYFAPSCG